jgi:hypothetical protein
MPNGRAERVAYTLFYHGDALRLIRLAQTRAAQDGKMMEAENVRGDLAGVEWAAR